MAIAGLQNVPVIESSILRESQPSSSSGRHVHNGRISTSASTLLRMWRELEDECAVNRAQERGRSRLQHEGTDGLSNCQDVRDVLEDSSVSESGSVNNSESLAEPLSEHEDRQSVTSEQSQDLSEVERERVRKIFREWMSSGVTVQTPNVPQLNRNSRGQWLGETERERVRVVREWIQMTSEQRETCVANREERVRDGQVLEQNDGRVENSRREIRRLCGRQALLDLLAKKEQERRLELQQLGEARPVSNFVHRNRIQSLLRLRSFQNMRSTELSRTSSAAESELGLLRQRQTVSGLREGFLSRLDNNAHVQGSERSNRASDNYADGFRDDQRQVNNAIEVLDASRGSSDLSGDVDVGSSANLNDVGSSANLNQSSGYSGRETSLQELVARVEARLELAVGADVDSRQDTDTVDHSRSENGDFNDLEESQETSRHRFDADGEETNVHSQSDNVEGLVSEYVTGQESLTQVDDLLEQFREYEEIEEESGNLSNEWREDQVELDRLHLRVNDEESSRSEPENNDGEQNDDPDYWNENASRETPRDWPAVPSGPGATSSGRVDSYYFSDDDNVYNVELRELSNRRRVSSLLHSGFRESLDQLIQSYVERQTQAPDDWEVHETSPLPFVAREQEHLGTDHDEESIEVGPTPVLGPQGHWGQAFDHSNWSTHEIPQRPGTDWEIINDLRIDMARLQQRLTNMQRILEACMDMQLELQRSVRQEVSAALNRPINQSEFPENLLPKDSIKWDCVTKGICCICSDSTIDSLLYRCGHMCTCTKCANVLVEGYGKCPMCQAPVVEVIRAYFI